MLHRIFASLALFTGAVVMMAACGGDYTAAEATERCNIEQMEHPDCMTPETLAVCVACFQDCGDSCLVLDTVCPTKFECIQD